MKTGIKAIRRPSDRSRLPHVRDASRGCAWTWACSRSVIVAIREFGGRLGRSGSAGPSRGAGEQGTQLALHAGLTLALIERDGVGAGGDHEIAAGGQVGLERRHGLAEHPLDAVARDGVADLL